MAKRKPYQPLVAAEIEDQIPGTINGWALGYQTPGAINGWALCYYDSYRIQHGGNGTLASYKKGDESIELGRSNSDYYVLVGDRLDAKTIGWSSDIAIMIQLLTDTLIKNA